MATAAGIAAAVVAVVLAFISRVAWRSGAFLKIRETTFRMATRPGCGGTASVCLITGSSVWFWTVAVAGPDGIVGQRTGWAFTHWTATRKATATLAVVATETMTRTS